jgi:1-deoxy-D-xylulose-5-phosphate reductoisomerase
MRKKIAILGSTGSIGKYLIDIISKDKKNFDIILLTANKNYNTLLKQAKKFKVKNIIISDKDKYLKLKNKKNKINIFNNYDNLNKIFSTKADYIMSAISGINGLEPTFKSIKHTKKIAIANKESIICAWDILQKELKKNKTKFVPVDSEHFSIWSVLTRSNKNNIDKIFITASGGPFYKLPLSRFSKIRIKDAIKHPNWTMGKKISVDSATMMNKVFEIIEAKNIFNLPINKLKILVHQKSYLHAIVKFKNGLSHLVIHDTDMSIPIFNSLHDNKVYFRNQNNLNLNKLNHLNLEKPNLKKFPLIKVLKKLPDNSSLYETILVSTNDTLVDLFLEKKIHFQSISKIFFSIINDKKFYKFKSIIPRNINDIINLKNIIQKEINSRYI